MLSDLFPFSPLEPEGSKREEYNNCNTLGSWKKGRGSHPRVSPFLSLVDVQGAPQRERELMHRRGACWVYPGAGSCTLGERLYIHPTHPGGMVGYPPSPTSHHDTRAVCAACPPSHHGTECRMCCMSSPLTMGERPGLCASCLPLTMGERPGLCAACFPLTMGERPGLCAEVSSYHGRKAWSMRRGLFSPKGIPSMRRGLFSLRYTLVYASLPSLGCNLVYICLPAVLRGCTLVYMPPSWFKAGF